MYLLVTTQNTQLTTPITHKTRAEPVLWDWPALRVRSSHPPIHLDTIWTTLSVPGKLFSRTDHPYVWYHHWTRQHSKRIHTIHLETIHASVSVATARCHSERVWVGPQKKQFEQVSSDDHQMSLTGARSPGLMSGGGFRSSGLIWCYLLPPLDRHLWKHYLPQTSFAGDKNLGNSNSADVGSCGALKGTRRTPFFFFIVFSENIMNTHDNLEICRKWGLN